MAANRQFAGHKGAVKRAYEDDEDGPASKKVAGEQHSNTYLGGAIAFPTDGSATLTSSEAQDDSWKTDPEFYSFPGIDFDHGSDWLERVAADDAAERASNASAATQQANIDDNASIKEETGVGKSSDTKVTSKETEVNPGETIYEFCRRMGYIPAETPVPADSKALQPFLELAPVRQLSVNPKSTVNPFQLTKHNYRWYALLTYVGGQVAPEPCTKCTRNGRWSECVVAPTERTRTSLRAACASCVYSNYFRDCSFVQGKLWHLGTFFRFSSLTRFSFFRYLNRHPKQGS